MNPDKLKKLQAEVRIGGKGTQRRKKKIVHTTPASDDKKLKQTLKKLALNVIPGIEEVNIIKTDGTVLHIRNPKTQAAVAINTFAITGNDVTKTVAEMLPGILPQLGPRDLENLKKLSGKTESKCGTTTEELKSENSQKDSDDEGVNDIDDGGVPQLVDDFEAVALAEFKTEDAKEKKKQTDMEMDMDMDMEMEKKSLEIEEI